MRMIKILHVEDDPDDVELLQEAFTLNNISCHVDVVTEGDSAIPFLERSHTLPDIIVMDLNLPRLHGRELLALLKQHARFAHIPVVIMTTSSMQTDLKFTAAIGAVDYITKPNTMEGFSDAVQKIRKLSRD